MYTLRAVNPNWNHEAAIGHCVRSFRNNVAVWWEEAVPANYSPKKLRAIVTTWKVFKVVF
jgi:hypothetical protein